MTTPGEARRAISEPQHCPFCGRKRSDDALVLHLADVHDASMMLFDVDSAEQLWPIPEPAEVVRK